MQQKAAHIHVCVCTGTEYSLKEYSLFAFTQYIFIKHFKVSKKHHQEITYEEWV